MGSPTLPTVTKKHPAFAIACGLFACIAFAQLLSVGVSIASRSGEIREVVRYVESEPLIVSVPTLRDEYKPTSSFQPRSVDDLLSAYTDESDLPQSTAAPELVYASDTPQRPSENSPLITNPQVERLIKEAGQTHIQGDLVATLIKLEEAEIIDPNEPAIFYNKAQLFEDLGHWDQATNNYEKLFTMGSSIGVYYHKAAFKLSNGINPETSKQDIFVIGNVLRRIAPDKLSAKLTIPIRSTPDGDFDPSLLEVKVHHYDLVDNKKIEAVPPSRAGNIKDRWISAHPDWASNEEFAESTYTLPAVTETDIHIFGDRKYFGYVAELYYKNELIDQQAFPRRLHAIHAEKNNQPSYDTPFDFPFDEALPNINPDNPLLPALPRH